MNHIENVTVVAAAVSDHAGLSSFTTGRGPTMNSIAAAGDGALMVSPITLDSAGLPPPALIKMDIEGAESAALSGARETLRRDRPVVFVALHSPEQRRLCAEILRSAGYSLRDLEHHPISGTPETDEIYAVPAPASR
jgi:hypothetical protein